MVVSRYLDFYERALTMIVSGVQYKVGWLFMVLTRVVEKLAL